MKTTLITTFAIAVMIFAFNANPVTAGGEKNKQEFQEFKDGAKKGFEEFGELLKCVEGKNHHECRDEGRISQLEELDPREEEAFAGFLDYCRKHGNCMMQSEENVGQDFATVYDAFCLESPDNYLCFDESNGYADPEDRSGERDIADSGNEGSTSAASASDQ